MVTVGRRPLWRPQPHAATLRGQDGTMASSPTDDFGAFAGKEHMFFGLAEPYTLIRAELESGLRKQVPDSVLERIETHGEAKFLTLGRKTPDPSKVVVAHYGFSVLARLSVSYAAGAKREVIETAITFLFVNVDLPGEEKFRTHFDLHGDVARNFTDERFQEWFLSFRAEFP